jgi:hypothetical protein
MSSAARPAPTSHTPGMGLRVEGLGFGGLGLGFEALALGFEVPWYKHRPPVHSPCHAHLFVEQGLGFGIWGLEFRFES